jgi:hypothetical protein
MRVMLVSRKNCSTYRNEARTHKSNMLASDAASATWGTHIAVFVAAEHDIKASRSFNLKQSHIVKWVTASEYTLFNAFAHFAPPAGQL